MNFKEFFKNATDHEPYPFQERFADATNTPHLVRAPTGAGKTATAVLGWLYRWTTRPTGTPRRLVYCLPMRVLVEQSEREAKKWIANLKIDVDVHVLMGGVDTNEWYLHPERPAILIGTQDMLLSRALNRGYAENRFHWPIDFGLLNNDCLWVFDEPQLMANGVSTSAQLAGFRKQFGTLGSCASIWMSATLEPEWLDTIDFRGKFPGKALELGKDRYGDDYDETKPLFKRLSAAKTLKKLQASASKEMKEVVAEILGVGDEPGLHQPGTQTLVVLNTVDRAKAVYDALKKSKKVAPNLLLVHSRFRPAEREKLNDALQEKGDSAKDRIIIATQVVEAGVDISSHTLITELAPWASTVQRAGRCNRTGDDGPGRVYWIDSDEKLPSPYEKTDLDFAREQLKKLEGKSASPRDLDIFKRNENIVLPFDHKHVLRRRDLLDLYDTAPDLSGNDIDIARFVRSDDPDTDVQVFWRDLPDNHPLDDEPAPNRLELCNVPIGQVRIFLETLVKKKISGYLWDYLDDEWQKVDPKQLRPGLQILLPSRAGGYSNLGWDARSEDAVAPLPRIRGVNEESAGSDPNSEIPARLTIAEHTQNVYGEMTAALKQLGEIAGEHSDDLLRAARWHDVGKAHEAFQTGMRRANPLLDQGQLWAKSGSKARLRYGRKYFRHELASALIVLQQRTQWPFAIAYLIATHHGKVRLSIRAPPGEDPPDDPEIPFALGVRHGDSLPEVDLGGDKCEQASLSLLPMLLGADPSWTANALQLLGEAGPFKLAYLEALLRAADVRASQKEANHA